MLVEGPAGTGKTELAKSVARMTGSRLIRLQCYEGLDESKALYEWNYKKQLLRIQADSDMAWQELEEDIFAEEFLLARPLLEAIRSTEPVVLLVDEVDRVELETEALLLEVLSEYQVSIPELGTVRATQVPLVFLTSNNTRELSEALKRRCLYLHIDYPQLDRERAIVETRVPGIGRALADQVARIVRSLRGLDLKKQPSVSETIDWARTLVVLGVAVDRRRAGPRHPAHPPQVPIGHRTRREGAGRGRVPRLTAEFAVLDLLAGFVTELRAAGIPVSLTEHLDAAEALGHIPIEDREAIKYTLGASLVKSSAHWRAYETTFEIYFSLRGPDYSIDDGETGDGDRAPGESSGQEGSAGQLGRASGGGAEGMTPEELADLLYTALLRGQRGRLGRRRPPGGDPLRRAWSRAGRWAAPTTSTERCGTSTSRASSTASSRRPGRTHRRAPERGAMAAAATLPARSPPSRSGCFATSTRPGSTSCAVRSRTRSAVAWWPTGGARR